LLIKADPWSLFYLCVRGLVLYRIMISNLKQKLWRSCLHYAMTAQANLAVFILFKLFDFAIYCDLFKHTQDVGIFVCCFWQDCNFLPLKLLTYKLCISGKQTNVNVVFCFYDKPIDNLNLIDCMCSTNPPLILWNWKER
jgi:uncharacterized membrane protein